MVSRRTVLSLLPAGVALAYQQKGHVVILLGPPSSGKTTQAEKLKNAYGTKFISPATMMKMSHDRKSDFTKKIKGKLADDEILNDEGMNDLLKQSLNRMDTTKGFVLDGYPVTKGQADYLKGTLQEFGLNDPIVIILTAPEDVLRSRAQKSGRAQDKPEVFNRRLENYKTSIAFIESYYPAPSIHRIDASKSPDEVFAEIRTVLGAGK